jgi:lysophospholipase L1-like esterase
VGNDSAGRDSRQNLWYENGVQRNDRRAANEAAGRREPLMSVIVAYGDSNTWGYDPAAGARFPADVRWTGVMRQALGAGFTVIEEGLNGRTTVRDDPIEPHRSGLAYLPACLMSHAPLDLLIISLGCNDLKRRFSLPASEIALSAERLVLTAKSFPVGPGGAAPDIILTAPPPVVELTAFAEMFEGAREKSLELGARYRAVAELHGVGFVDAGAHIHCSPLDGIHFEADQHARLGRVMAAAAKARLG